MNPGKAPNRADRPATTADRIRAWAIFNHDDSDPRRPLDIVPDAINGRAAMFDPDHDHRWIKADIEAFVDVEVAR